MSPKRQTLLSLLFACICNITSASYFPLANTIFHYKHNDNFFNTFFSDFYGRSNWLIVALNFTIHSNATLPNPSIPRNRLSASCCVNLSRTSQTLLWRNNCIIYDSHTSYCGIVLREAYCEDTVPQSPGRHSRSQYSPKWAVAMVLRNSFGTCYKLDF